jgi:hypothetical protein
MSWARGFFRLWVAAAILWIGFATWVSFPNLRRNWAPDYSFSQIDYLYGKRPPSSLEVRWRGDLPVISSPPTQADAEAVAGWLWSNGHLAGTDRYIEQAKQLGSIHRSLYDRATAQRLSDYLMAAFVPPGILLAIGTLVAWALAGFRRKASSSA